MKRLRLLTLSLALLAIPALGDSVFSHPVADHPDRQQQLSELARAMAEASRVAGQFTQTKHLEILDRPLESTGHFSLDDQGRFNWEIHQPFAQGYHFRDGTLIRTLDGEEETVAPADEPSLYGFFQFFSALLQLTEDELGAHFTRYFRYPEGASGWELGLRPKDRRMRRVLKELLVQGSGTRIDRVLLNEPDGDRTELTFDYEHPEKPGSASEQP